MTLQKILIRNWRYHVRSHLAILLGSMIGCTVLTGALLVGDLLRSKLTHLDQLRLGSAQHAITSSRFFTSQLATRLAQQEPFRQALVVPILQLRGTVLVRDLDGNLLGYTGSVQILGVPSEFWHLFSTQAPDLTGAVAVNEVLARRLQLHLDNLLEIRLPRPSAIPQETLAGRSVDETGTAWHGSILIETRPIKWIVPTDQGGLFSLSPQLDVPSTVYLPLDDLQRRLRDSVLLHNAVNIVLIGYSNPSHDLEHSTRSQALRRALSLADYGLTLRMVGQPARYLSLETNRLLLEDSMSEIACQVANHLGWSAKPTLTYLVNLAWSPLEWSSLLIMAIGASCSSWSPLQAAFAWRSCYYYVPYVTVSILDPTEDHPWGPFYNWDGQRWRRPLDVGEILLTEPAANDLWPFRLWQWRVANHQDLGYIMASYFVESSGWLLQEKTARLRVAGVLSWRGAAVDPNLTPEFPGLRGTSPADWRPPFPRQQWHPEWIRDADDRHWRQHRAAPRAFVSLETAQHLGWLSTQGRWTSIRLAPPLGQQLNHNTSSELANSLLDALDPEKFGFQWVALRHEAHLALQQGPAHMFGGLFLGFSLFLVIAALLLIILLVRLQLLRRANEFGLFLALGFTPMWITRLVIIELGLIIIVGCVLGLPTALAYAWLLFKWIEKQWPTSDVLATRLVPEHQVLGSSYTFCMGLTISLTAAYVAVIWALREIRGFSARSLLAGRLQAEISPSRKNYGSKLGWIIAGSALLGAITCLGFAFTLPSKETAPWFFVSGGLLLLGGLTATNKLVQKVRGDIRRIPWWLWLGLRLVSRHPRRNLLTITLLALATFVISAVEVFYKTRPRDPFVRESGTGGFPLLAESDIPLPFVPGNLSEWQALLPDVSPERLSELLAQLDQWKVRIYGFRVWRGEDVSCLNFYQARRPRVLGVPRHFIDRGGFAFRVSSLRDGSSETNLWKTLTLPHSDFVPMIADAHTADWVLHLEPRQRFYYPGTNMSDIPMRLDGLLVDSVFQNSLLISEHDFARYFPGQPGYAFFLIETKPDASVPSIERMLERLLGEKYGFSTQRTLEVLEKYHRVENLYLQTFQMLGAFGLVLGSCGLAVVLLRNVEESQAELALLQALGYERRKLAYLLLVETSTLVVLGLTVGMVASAASLSPHWFIVGLNLTSVVRILGNLVIVLAVGMAAGLAAIYRVTHLPLLAVLRRE